MRKPMPFWKCYYHVIWATKHRAAWIIPPYERLIYTAIEEKSASLKCKIYALNGVADHLHVAVSIMLSMSVSQWVRNVKGASSHTMNASFALEQRFYWQEGYGVLTFGEKAFPIVKAYIENQKTHHAEGSTYAYLEQLDE